MSPLKFSNTKDYDTWTKKMARLKAKKSSSKPAAKKAKAKP